MMVDFKKQTALRMLVVSIFASTVVFAISEMASSKTYGEDNNWYVGEGVAKNMYVKYSLSYFDTNNGRPFDFTIYFKEQDDKGNWVAPVYVQDQGKVINGTFLLSSLDLTALGTSKIPLEMGEYRSAYANSLQWLAAYVPKPGLPLNAGSWGKIGSIGGPEIKPAGTQSLSVPGFSQPIDTTKIEYKKSVSNNIWVKNEFPYPVMAKTFVDVTTGTPPPQFQFILLETGSGEPPVPSTVDVEMVPPVVQRTERGDYFVQLDWTPSQITTGNETVFTVDVLDKDQFPLTKVSYNFQITDANSTSIVDLKNQFASQGTKSHNITFEKPAVINVKVTVNSVKGVDTGPFIETTEFPLKVN